MRKRDARKEVQKQINAVTSRIQEYRDGIESVEVSPGKLAVQKKDKFKNNLLQAIDSGKWESALSNLDLNEWKRKASTVGADRLSTGMVAAEDKMVQFREELIAYQTQLKQRLDAMPDATPEQREQKMLTNIREMRKFSRSTRRR